MNELTQFLRILWAKAWTNPFFVAAYSAAIGTAGDLLYDELQNGKLDFSPAGIHKLAAAAAGAAFVAVWHLYRPTPR